MQKPLPPLRALVAFEASVRHASFKLASRELNITPGAVSQQVHKLEEWLGFALFLRQTRQLQVTDQGLAYYSRIAPALEQISQVSQASRRQSSDSVKLSLPTTLAVKWLAPRMADFVIRHPAIDVHINATNSTVDFQSDAVDLAIRLFDGKDPALEAELVFADEVLLLCSPAYRDRLQLTDPDQLARATLLHVSIYRRWGDWLERFSSIDESARAKIPGLHFDQALLGIEAAKRDQGVVLSSLLMVGDELRRGELIEPFDLRLTTDKGFYVIHPKRQALTPAAQCLRTWLLEQFSTQETGRSDT